jgi:translocator assembly and maintenance protein 41
MLTARYANIPRNHVLMLISSWSTSQLIKYGVISTDTLCEDMMDWSTLYVAGRMHKPVRIIRPDARILLANQINLVSALRVALLMLPEEFTEVELWEQIAGISYAGASWCRSGLTYTD